ncbi:alpha/beta hydrolase family protein [Herpetosiphon giganteus]|uniref:alpha/beta hydrolase family protein n=1 Tax=Herpetosiphon giganteus TaxID=2029754 RepID=UPI00195A9D0C|nr:prolyl oligopeptidase family serine peptidase [Herpetosiphon giganteus]MBM7844742.1 acetyl esterase/lipase [Herpetosiphon giganteus]
MSDSILAQAAPPADQRIWYAADPLQFGDLRLPAGNGPFPVVIVVHGGFWRARYDLEHIGHVCAALTVLGYATWNIEYRRVGNGGGWPNTFFDVAQAADFVPQLAQTYPIDAQRVLSLGHSAGGHLALWLAARSKLAPTSPLWQAQPLRLQGVVSLAGVADLALADQRRLSQQAVQELLGGSPDDYPERYHDASPAALLPLGVPQIVLHGTDDGPVPFGISQSYVEQALAAGDEARLVALPNAHHFELIDPSSREWPAVMAAVQDLLATP